MLKVLSSLHVRGRLHSLPAKRSASIVNVGEGRSPLPCFLRSLTNQQGRSLVFWRKAFFCSDSGDGSEPPPDAKPAEEVEAIESADAEGGAFEEPESKASSAIVSMNPRPEDYMSVVALPLPHRPLFPGFYMPVYVKDPKLLAALLENLKRSVAYAGAFLLKEDPEIDSSSASESGKSVYDLKGKELFKRLHEVGTLAQITNVQGDQVVLLGHRRLRITEMVDEDPLTVKVDHLKEKSYDKDDDVIKATAFEVISTLRDVLKTSSLWRDHVQTYTQHIGDFNYARLADFGAAVSGANKLLCQQVVEELDVYKRLKLTLELVKKEMEISKIQESIAKAIEEKVSGEQRRYLLNEQLKAIKKELGMEADDKTALTAKFRERLEPNKDKCPQHVLQVIEEELTKLQFLEASSSEFNVTRNYLDWLTSLPWGNYSAENFDVHHAQKILDEDHYGLSDVKERILEFIAVGKLRGISQGKIICLSGPPGVGKTSIGRSIARALNRKFYRFSVGGLADVAEIKGHRRTYIGAMPGKMVQCLKMVGTANPLVLIDEIDKLGKGHAGDPASALLELLDPEQNINFLDHYLDVPIDLSKVLFVCTANVIEMIPNPLLDRMENIALAGYITDEKMHIARDYLEKTTREACGIKPEQVEVTDAALLSLIENYCREAGVRNLQKHIEKIYRKIALQLVRKGVTNEDSTQKEDSQESSNMSKASTKIVVGDNQIGEDTNPPTSSVETIKSFAEPNQADGDGGFVTFKFDNINTEINKITDKSGLVSTEGVEKLVSLMQLDITEKKIDLAGRIMLADVIAATEKSDFLNKFVQLRGVPVLDEWLQEVHKGKTDNGGNPHESEKLVEEFLLTLLRALEKLPINLNSLQICNIGKSVNNLRSHKNMEIQKRARGLVDTWKKRVDAEMSKISEGKFVGSGQPASFPMKPGHSDVTQAGNKRTGSTDATAKISITRPSAGKALPSKHGTTDSNKKPIVPAPIIASSKDLHCKTAAGSGVSILSFPAVKEEKSNASSPSQSNSHSCSGDQVKTMTSSWKEEPMSSVVGSGNASKLTGSMNRSRRSSNGILVANVSGNHKETHLGRCMSVNKVMTAEKTSQGEKALDIPVGDHGSISRLIVRLPNTGRSPGKSEDGGSLEDQLVISSKSSSVGISDKNDLNDGRLKLKNDVPLSQTTDVNTMSCQGNDVKEGLSGIEEHRRNAEVPARTSCLSGNENGACSSEPRASSYNSMLGLVESCATYSEAASPLAVGDDMGMNPLATVATGKISRSNIIAPIDSLGTPRTVEEPCTANDEPMLGLSCDDEMAERNTPHDESANVSSEKEEKKVDCVLATGLLQTDNNLTSKSAKSTQLQTTQSTVTCMSSLDNLDSENIVVKPGEERIDEPEPEEGDSIGADPITDKQLTDVQISSICTDNKPNFTGPLKDENTSFERNCKIEDNNNMCISDVKAGNKCDLDVTDSGRKLEAPVVEEHLTSQVVKKPSSSSNSIENLLKSSSPDSEISLPAVSMPSPTVISESNVMKSNSMEISPLELPCEAKEKNIPHPSTDELVVVSDAVSRVTAEILENLKEANESGSVESSAIQEMLSTKIKETENSAKAFRSSGSEEVREEDHASYADRCSSIVFAEQVVTRLEVDLNEGIPVGEGNQGQPVISSTKSPSVHMPCHSHFSNSKSTNLSASVTVAAPAKGPFVPPEVLLKAKGEPGWKGTAATSAFRPAEPRKASNILDTLPSDGVGKKSNLPLNIDLNIADEDVEDMASQNSIQMTGITTANDFPTKAAVGVDLDLNRVDDSVENGQFSASTNCRLELPLLHIQSASGGLPAGKSNILRNFDLNNRPGIDEVGTEIQPRSQQANYASIVPSLAPVTGHITNNLEPGYASSSFCANSYPVAVPSFLPDRGEQSNPAVATVGSQRISVSLSAGNLGNDIYRGLALSSSPAMVISQATTFPYANLSFPSTFSLGPASFSGGSTPYVDSSSGGGLCFPAYSSLLVSPAAAVSSHYPRPYTISFPEGGTSSLSRQGLDLNTGPGSGYLEGKEENLPSSSRYLLPASSQVFMEDQTRMHGVPGVGSKRKEPEGSWDAERPTERSAKQSSWK